MNQLTLEEIQKLKEICMKNINFSLAAKLRCIENDMTGYEPNIQEHLLLTNPSGHYIDLNAIRIKTEKSCH